MNYISGNYFLNLEQMKQNATYIAVYLILRGWSINAIAGMLGNMQSESTINPGIYESLDSTSSTNGFGLVQWTPNANYKIWVQNTYGNQNYGNMDYNLERIIYEKNNGIQYYPTSSYPYNFNEFSTSNKTAYELACAFAWNYERSYIVLYGTEEEKEALRQERGGQAQFWYDFLTENPPTPTTRRKKGFNFILFSKQIRKLTNIKY